MYNVIAHSDCATETQITDIVFEACRANEERKPYQRIDGYTVNFDNRFTKAGEHVAVVYNNRGQICGSAVVDKFDC